MNLESMPSKKTTSVPNDDFDFDFKPITSGLGFHHPKLADIKPVFVDKVVPSSSTSHKNFAQPKRNNEMAVYQNDLSLFYGRKEEQDLVQVPLEETTKAYKIASKGQRTLAYLLDLLLITSIVGLVLTVMARIIDMDVLETWQKYPHETLPLLLTLFIGFYVIYFCIFDKSGSSTVGKNILSLRVVDEANEGLGMTTLFVRTIFSLANFISLGLFSYFDLQNKVTGSKVIRIK